VWDSLAILEFLAERHPECAPWPHGSEARVVARSVAAEMHAGFVTLRDEMSMDLLARLPPPSIEDA
jgi:glutathione S-transferase